MPYERQTRASYYRQRTGPDPSKRAYKEATALEDRDRRLGYEMDKSADDYRQALTAWSKNEAALDKDRVEFFKTMSKTMGTFIDDVVVKGLEMKQESDIRDAVNWSRTATQEEKDIITQRGRLLQEKEEDLSDKKREIWQKARDNNLIEYEELLGGRGKVYKTAVHIQIATEALKTVDSQFEAALADSENAIYYDPVDEVNFTGSEANNLRREGIVKQHFYEQWLKTTNVGGLNNQILMGFVGDKLDTAINPILNRRADIRGRERARQDTEEVGISLRNQLIYPRSAKPIKLGKYWDRVYANYQEEGVENPGQRTQQFLVSEINTALETISTLGDEGAKELAIAALQNLIDGKDLSGKVDKNQWVKYPGSDKRGPISKVFPQLFSPDKMQALANGEPISHSSSGSGNTTSGSSLTKTALDNTRQIGNEYVDEQIRIFNGTAYDNQKDPTTEEDIRVAVAEAIRLGASPQKVLELLHWTPANIYTNEKDAHYILNVLKDRSPDGNTIDINDNDFNVINPEHVDSYKAYNGDVEFTDTPFGNAQPKELRTEVQVVRDLIKGTTGNKWRQDSFAVSLNIESRIMTRARQKFTEAAEAGKPISEVEAYRLAKTEVLAEHREEILNPEHENYFDTNSGYYPNAVLGPKKTTWIIPHVLRMESRTIGYGTPFSGTSPAKDRQEFLKTQMLLRDVRRTVNNSDVAADKVSEQLDLLPPNLLNSHTVLNNQTFGRAGPQPGPPLEITFELHPSVRRVAAELRIPAWKLYNDQRKRAGLEEIPPPVIGIYGGSINQGDVSTIVTKGNSITSTRIIDQSTERTGRPSERRILNTIGFNESSNRYDAVNTDSYGLLDDGVTARNPALGRYQMLRSTAKAVCEQNGITWPGDKAFLTSKKLQDKVAGIHLRVLLDQAVAAEQKEFPDEPINKNRVLRRVAAGWYSGDINLWNNREGYTQSGTSYPSIYEYGTKFLNQFSKESHGDK